MRWVVFLLCFWLLATASTVAPERFAWDEKRLLRWSDFKGSPDTLEPWGASSSTGISQSYAVDGSGVLLKEHVVVAAHFYPDFSWSRPRHRSKHLLGHEQTHFDITEVYARKLARRIEAYSFTSNSLKEIKTIYEEIERERVAVQQQFDKESNHSMDHMKEIQWELRVPRWLDDDFEE